MTNKPVISAFDAPIQNTTPSGEVSIKHIYEAVQGSAFKQVTEEYRALTSLEEQKVYKSTHFMYVTFAGTFSSRSKDKLKKISGFICIDIDHISRTVRSTPAQVAQWLWEDKDLPTSLIFVSPSADGLKVVIPTKAESEKEYKEYNQAIAKYIKDKHDIDIDPLFDLPRACFLCYDPLVKFDPLAAPLDRSFIPDEFIDKEDTGESKQAPRPSTSNKAKSLFTKFNEDPKALENILNTAGYTKVFEDALETRYLRPGGSTNSYSVKVFKNTNRLYVHSSSCRGLTPQKDYSAVEALMALNGLDIKEARDYISDAGYESDYGIGKLEEKFERDLEDMHAYMIGDKIKTLKVSSNGEVNFGDLHRTTLRAVCGAKDKTIQDALEVYMFKHRRLNSVRKVIQVSDPLSTESRYDIDYSSDTITIYYPSIRPKVQDNKFINDYLDSFFGEYSDFIRQYMAYYAFSNHKLLPTLIIYSPEHGTGKSTFADHCLRPICPALTVQMKDQVGNFNPEGEKKLAIIEENSAMDKTQYNWLKKVTGSTTIRVEKKYLNPYEIPNNFNVILISNNPIPLYVESTEKPQDERNNRFFVFRPKAIDAADLDKRIQQKLEDRMGHYIRTELYELYQEIKNDTYRFSIPVPITPWEEELFANNETGGQINARDFLSDLLYDLNNLYDPSTSKNALNQLPAKKVMFLEQLRNKLFATKLFEEYKRPSTMKNQLLKEGVLKATTADKVKNLNSHTYRFYEIKDWPGLEEHLKNYPPQHLRKHKALQ